ncbi:33030_t:CDS:2, partial [Gigaspora margarita]
MLVDKEGKKLSKSENKKGMIWLDEKKTSLKELNDFFRNMPDLQAATFIRQFTFLSESQINKLAKLNAPDCSRRIFQRILYELSFAYPVVNPETYTFYCSYNSENDSINKCGDLSCGCFQRLAGSTAGGVMGGGITAASGTTIIGVGSTILEATIPAVVSLSTATLATGGVALIIVFTAGSLLMGKGMEATKKKKGGVTIGDIFGKTGRKIIQNYLPRLKEEYQIDLTIANVENATNGKGISFKHYQELKGYGIDVMTSGNHIFANEETREYIKEFPDLLRPLNSNPYHPDIHLVDFHAETTAEKNAFSLYHDGKISAIWGTHTHVQTADERIFSNGTAFITDLGMTGPYGGVIGAKPEAIIQRAKYGLPAKMVPHEDNGQFNGVVLTIDNT